ncbi:3687_t:CDS:10 [Acaulospora colombiana]|uniref:3687_t:CDS:1 n=1 Tax=Acaulospora colombiana TaxID=27376 RepID=A0ACA9K0X0_9GLOM|nr:3687_t:CDS:10 [Acaulospora colombiana]
MASARDQLLTILSEAASQQPERMKAAEAQLKQWEVESKFYSTFAINAAEKAEIRSKLLLFMDEEFNQLATQYAVMVSKIARLDYPNEWLVKIAIIHDNSVKLSIIEKFMVQALLLLKALIRKTSYNQDLRELNDEKIVKAIRIVDEQILTSNIVESCAELLITDLISLKKEDLEMWDDDPEGWINYDETDHWEYQLRPCAEKVFMELLSQYRTSQTSNLILKDAIYCAIGLGAHELYDELDFDSWLVNNLLVEIANSDPRIIRRRIAWVIGRWVCVRISKENRPKVYDAMTYLLKPEEDLVVRMTAAINLRYYILALLSAHKHKKKKIKFALTFFSARVDEWDFDSNGFIPYLDRSITLLTRLIGEVEQFDSRMKILNCLSLIVERMEELIAPYAGKITGLLPPLWQAAQDEHLFKPAILVILTKLVQALRNESMNLHDFVIPIIQYSVNPNIEEHIYLLEDALDLWLAVIENSVECTSGLFSLVPSAISFLEFGTEILKKVLKILESFIILVPDMVIQSYCYPIMNNLTQLLGDLKPEACRAIVHLLDTIFQACPFSSLGEAIVNTGLLGKLIEPMVNPSGDYAYILVSYMSLLARVVLIEPEFVINFINVAGRQQGPVYTDKHLLNVILDVWVDKFDNIGHPKQRKLNAMAFAMLISTTNPIILGYLPLFVGVWGDVLSEVKESGGGDALVYWQEDISIGTTDDIDDTPETKRKRTLLQRDPVHTTNLAQFIRLKLGECEALNGGARIFDRIDESLLAQLNGLMS